MKTKKLYLAALLWLFVLLLPVSALAGWKTTDQGKIYTQKKAPGYYTGWHKIKGSKYYFDPASGVMATGLRKIQVKGKTYTYYFGTNGKLVTGLTQIDGLYYYFNKKGRMQYGFIKTGGKTYYSDPATGLLARNVWIDGIYYFQNDCTMAVSTTVSGKYVGADGRYTGPTKNVGFVRKDGKTLYYDRNGKVVNGWLTVGGVTYYLKPELATDYFTVGTYTYFARADGSLVKNTWKGRKYLSASGALTKGWATIAGSRYYFGENGDYVTGRKTIDGKVYRFDTAGRMQKKLWYKSGKYTYYYGSDGARVSGLQKIGKRWYYFNSKGRLKKQFFKATDGSLYYGHKTKGYLFRNKWFTKSGKKYYATEDCSLATGLNKIGSKLYGFSETGVLYVKSWQTIGGKRYYFDKNGAAITGKWKKIGANRYYFYADGSLATSTVIDGYTIDAAGIRKGEKLADGWTTVAGAKHYVVNGKSVTGWQTISGSRYFFNSAGEMATGIQTIGGKKYYFYPTGILAVNLTIAVSSKEYTINAKGVVTSEKVISASGTTKGSQIANFAIKYIGNRYVYGGTSLTNGADCSGFVMTVFANFGIKLLRVADDQLHGPSSSYISSGYKKAVVVSPGYLMPGDLVFYGSSNSYGTYASHVGIYIGNGNIVHASNSQAYPAGGIKISPYNYQTPIGYVRYWS